jgi:hypothetical protein
MTLPSTHHNGVSLIVLGITIAGVIWALSLPKKQGGNKMFYLGIALIVIGCAFVIARLDFRVEAQSNIKTTIQCCVLDNTYQIAASNQGSDTDTIVITLGTNGAITNIQALMGASLPTIVSGGIGANFVNLKIPELLPHIPLNYLIYIHDDALEPHEFTAWSEKIKDNVTATFTGQCPHIAGAGPEEAAAN